MEVCIGLHPCPNTSFQNHWVQILKQDKTGQSQILTPLAAVGEGREGERKGKCREGKGRGREGEKKEKQGRKGGRRK